MPSAFGIGAPSAPKAPPMVNVYDPSGSGQVLGQTAAPFSGVTAVQPDGAWADAAGQWHNIPAPPPPPPDFSGMFADMLSQMQANNAPAKDTAKANTGPADVSPVLSNDKITPSSSGLPGPTPPSQTGNDLTDPNKSPGDDYVWDSTKGRWVLKSSAPTTGGMGVGVTPPSPV